MLSMLVAYNEAGEVIATLGHLVARDAEGRAIGLHDFGETEAEGLPLTNLWRVPGAVGSGAWPEWLDARAHDFDVELDEGFSRGIARDQRPEHRILALRHRGSGHRRQRADVEQAIAIRISEADGRPTDIRDLVGGPERPLLLDGEGRTSAVVERAERPVDGAAAGSADLVVDDPA